MGFLDKLFGNSSTEGIKQKPELPWFPLTNLEQLDVIEMESEAKTVAIFKHSTRCGISKMVLRKFEREYQLENEGGLKLYFLDLVSYREVSNEIAKRYGIRHESPQLIVLKNGNVVSDASHQAIEAGMVVDG